MAEQPGTRTTTTRSCASADSGATANCSASRTSPARTASALAPGNRWKITDIAYNNGINDDPVECTTTVYSTNGYPAFNCHGFVGGSSGSPWLNHGYVDGVIGGWHQGGCFEYTSYTAPFTSAIDDLWWRATQSGPGDIAPAPGGDGC